ncbi:MAG: TetR/AcrR family transcriptional regulator [Anaerolineales bacterium]
MQKTEDPRVVRTRQLIEQAFEALLDERGFQSLRVQDITERAGINRATFYAHFTDKYDLLNYMVLQRFRAEIEKRTLNACHFSQQNLRALILAVCEFLIEAHGHCKMPNEQFESLIETQVRGQIQLLLKNWLEQEKTTVSTDIAATATSWAIYGLAQQWSHDKNRLTAEIFADKVLPLVMKNLGLDSHLNG